MRLLSMKRKSRNIEGIKWLVLGICIIVLAYLISVYWYQLTLIQGDSMSPAYHDGQLVVLDKHSEDFEAGDVIAFYCEGLDANLVKRIVAGPEDYVIIMDGKLYVNGEPSIVCSRGVVIEYAGIAGEGIRLKPGQYFVLGDNIEDSRDSRYQEVGIVNEKYIIGKVM